MNDVDDFVKGIIRGSRDDAIELCIELCRFVRDEGGCANCCVEQLEKIKRDLHADDLAHDRGARH